MTEQLQRLQLPAPNSTVPLSSLYVCMYYVVAAPKRISPHFKLAPADANVNVNVSISSSPLSVLRFALQTPSSLIPSGYSYNYSLSLRSSSLLLFLCCCLVLTLEIVRLRDLCLWSVFGTLRALSPFRCVHCFRVRYLFFFVFFFSLSPSSLFVARFVIVITHSYVR